MKLLFVSDIHGDFKKLRAVPEVDQVLIGGDFTTLGTPETFTVAVNALEALYPGFLGVIGNMDCREGEQILDTYGHWLRPEVQEVGTLKMMGIGGGNRSPFNSPVEWEDADMAKILVNKPPVDILVSHTPPMESGADTISNGAHVGSTAIADYIRRTAPRLVLCGHIHEAAGIYQMGETFVVNPGPDTMALISWNEGLPLIQLIH